MFQKTQILYLIASALRILLAGVFGWAGIAKLMAPQTFSEGIAAFQIFPNATINIIAVAVPMIEVAAAILLLSPWWQRQGSLICATLSMTFITIFWWAGAHGIPVSCSCFGSFGGVTSAQTGVLRGVVLLILSGFLYLKGLANRLPEKH